MIRTLVRAIASVLLASAVHAGETSLHEYELDNGMKVLVRADERAPVVVSQVWYRVGSVDEHRGVTGVSHAVEHMMFKGTNDYAPGQMSQIIAGLGGEENAFTSRAYTAYYQQIGAQHLDRMLELEAERMSDLRFPEAEVDSEMQVVREERRQRVEDQPRALVHERLRAAALPSSPARSPVIGWRGDLESMTRSDLVQWYEQWYGPNNAAVVVVGDVEPERVLELARRHFGAKKAVELPPRPARSELEPRGETRLEVAASAKLPYLAMAWRVPSLATAEQADDVYALDVLAAILDGGRSARLQRNLVRGQQMASSASASALESALDDEIAALKAGEIDTQELERVKTNVRARDVFERDSMFYQALCLGRLEMTGVGQDAYDAYLEGVEAVTAADVARVAKAYLVDERLTVARLVPQGVDGAGQGAAPTGQDP
ncbi:MAG: peptidase M16 [Proteobacteria bacterium SW_6_67_9]|nr:MAG: peptidase M16 [Proteobacteria bacterium SW_6_67_9]